MDKLVVKSEKDFHMVQQTTDKIKIVHKVS